MSRGGENRDDYDVASITKQNQDKNESLFGVNEKWCSSLRKMLIVSIYVLRFIKLRVWNRISSEKQKGLRDRLLTTIFDKLEDHGSIKSEEVKLVSLLWVSFIQHKI